ncbi:hypothetical protein BDY17DRAFT_321249 [Neohortaea acidophila]|uniref:Uncharacterized protein n=1 Tax=Neohortaea acidophila TaxID=245834 RepID=A0A6A6Q237_9PEZI|nr:uncharacterized protein BDY17DRAFT_321249 [Neohortaea acidophila]KAF2486460.1 hypothetical protein BDY17DRAFT_321249 [Neohortaea acidophila]
MSGQQPNAWHTASRSRNSSSRTPQNRSGTQSPSQQTTAAQAPRQDAGRSQQPRNPPANNVWAQRSSNSAASNGSVKAEASPAREDEYRPVNGFNAAEVKQFLARDVAGATVYKPAEVAGTGGRNSGSAWGHKPNHMANNQPFFAHLAKQTTTVESGG